MKRVITSFIWYLLIGVIGAAKNAPAKCLENGRFYRNPDRESHKMWTSQECSKYFLCLEGEVFDFRCSSGLLFDVNRQICDFKNNVDNCDITSENEAPEPLLKKAKCPEANHLGCGDGTCLPNHYFCDGSIDCPDGSDEAHCDPLKDPNAATECEPTCSLPECFCSKDGTQIPKKLKSEEVPQMVILTFDDAINYENYEIYTKTLFNHNSHKNPNGCPVKATFFVSHQYNNYQQTQKMWNDGHEIAVHSITHRGPETWWSYNATMEDWFDEMVGQANILHQFSHIRMSEIRGMRVPFLNVGWNRQFLMMKEFGFVYDSSLVAPFSDPPLWPYTLDHQIPHECNHQNCPSRSYPGLWQMVINPLEAGDYTCAMIDSCPNTLSPEDVYQLLMRNFRRHYLTNKAPFGLYLHSTWLKKDGYLNAINQFMEDTLKQPDVWFVTNWQAINWIKNPIPLKQLPTFKNWDCGHKFEPKEIACNVPNVCKLRSRIFQQDRFLYTCASCPERYPWIRNEFGLE